MQSRSAWHVASSLRSSGRDEERGNCRVSRQCSVARQRFVKERTEVVVEVGEVAKSFWRVESVEMAWVSMGRMRFGGRGVCEEFGTWRIIAL